MAASSLPDSNTVFWAATAVPACFSSSSFNAMSDRLPYVRKMLRQPVGFGIAGHFAQFRQRLRRAGVDAFQAPLAIPVVDAAQEHLHVAPLVRRLLPDEAQVRADGVALRAVDAFFRIELRQEPLPGTAQILQHAAGHVGEQ